MYENVTPKQARRGRGALENPTGRFERLVRDPDADAETEDGAIETVLYRDPSRSILSSNDSPDVGFTYSLNPYRGCEHGCIYCFARPTHEYLGLSAGLDFESKLFVKEDAPALLRKAFSAKSWKPQVVAMSGVTDCYQPVERKLEITRRCLEVFAEFRNPVAIITKNHLVTRDLDHLRELAQYQAVQVNISITTLDRELARTMEPRASTPERRLDAVRQLAEAGIPVNVLMAPIIPGLTDHDIPQLLERAAEAGAVGAHYVMLRLPHGVKDLFQNWLEAHAPLRKDKVLNHLRAMRGGKLNDPNFSSRMKGSGVYAQMVAALFAKTCQRVGLNRACTNLSAEHFRHADKPQLSLF